MSVFDKIASSIIRPGANITHGGSASKPRKTASSSVTVDREISDVVVNQNNGSSMGSATNSSTGEQLSADNPLIQSKAVADAVAEWVKNVVTNRTHVSGEYRADPRLDVYDKIQVQNKYMTADIIVSELEYSYNGAFTAKYKGRVVPTGAAMLNEV